MTRRKYRLLFTVSEFMFSSQVRNICDLVSQLDREIFEMEIGALAVGDEATAEIAALDVPFFKLRLQPTRPVRARDVGTMILSPVVLSVRRYDLVHSLLYQSIFTEALFVKTLGRAKYVYTKSNLEWDNHPSQWRLKSRLADRIVSISDATSTLLDRQGFGERTEKIYLGIDTDRFSLESEKGSALRRRVDIPENSFLFGCVAQFVEWKEHLTVVKAFELIADKYPDAWLAFCGPHHNDAYYQACRSYIQGSRHAGRIRLVGTLRDMPAFYSAIDAFVLASRFETFGYVYVEAMSCERPVIGCRAAGPLEIIDEDRTGLFCNVSDPGDLAQKMGRYIGNRPLAQEHGRAARTRVRKVFSRHAMATKSAAMYLQTLGHPCA